MPISGESTQKRRWCNEENPYVRCVERRLTAKGLKEGGYAMRDHRLTDCATARCLQVCSGFGCMHVFEQCNQVVFNSFQEIDLPL